MKNQMRGRHNKVLDKAGICKHGFSLTLHHDGFTQKAAIA